jgi:hypothetical protein
MKLIKPTTADVKTAQIRAYAMHGAYTCTPFETGDLFTVQNIADPKRTYGVTTIPGLERCSCPQFDKKGVCKHQAFVAQTLEIEAEEARESAKADAESLVYCN